MKKKLEEHYTLVKLKKERLTEWFDKVVCINNLLIRNENTKEVQSEKI